MTLRSAVTMLSLFSVLPAFTQVRMSKLVVESHQVYTLENSDIMVADTLVMKDSSCIKLNRLRSENYIRARVAIIGNNCVIDGRGIHGKPGANGIAGAVPTGPCTNGGTGRNGARGLDGTPGINLFLYIDSLNLNSRLIINLSGGNGGDGGNGGIGGGGGQGTKHCSGGNGGNGGAGGAGGNGGAGGKLVLGAHSAAQIKAAIGERVMLYYKGGTFGYGGIAGYAGPAGLGPQQNNGRSGTRGVDGLHGRPGDIGTILFEDQ